MSTGLQCRDLDGGYGNVEVLRDVTFDAAPGSVLAVLGPNGSGKTTLLMTLAGFLPRLGGDVSVDGESLRSGRPSTANKAGVVLVPDDRALFKTLSVEDNLEAARSKGGPTARSMLEVFPDLEKRWTVKAGDLSGGEQQMLAVARALVQRPRVLLIDEMSMGLAPVIVESLLPTVRDIAESTGAVVVLVEQHIRMALRIADHALVLVHGSIALSDTAANLRANPEVLEAAYLGEVSAHAAPAGTGS